jgi:hypothetical protein
MIWNKHMLLTIINKKNGIPIAKFALFPVREKSAGRGFSAKYISCNNEVLLLHEMIRN